MVAQVGYSVARRSRSRVALCAICTVHVETRSAGFLVEPQNQGQRFVSGFASKPLGRFVSSLASKPLGRFLPVWAQNRWYDFLLFDLKTGGDGFLRFDLKTGGDSFPRFGLKIGGFGFPDLGLKTNSYGLVIWASKSLRWFLGLGHKTKWAIVCRLHLPKPTGA
jgi:hypothetical protein